MRKPLLLLAFSLILISLSFASANAAPDFTVNPGHPRLFITPSNIATLKQRAATTHADTYGVLKAWCDQNWNNLAVQSEPHTFYFGDKIYDSPILRYALIYKLGQISGFDYSQHTINDYGDKTIQIMLNMANSGTGYNAENAESAAIAYDWVNERMTAAQKQTVVNWFHSIVGDNPTYPLEKTGYNFPLTHASFYPGLAFYGDGIDDALAQKYVDVIKGFLDNSRAVSHEAGEDGGHVAGLCYAKYYYGVGYHLGQDFYALTTATSLTIADTFNTYTYMNGYPTWFLYGVQPGPVALSAYPSSNEVATLTKYEDCGSWIWNVNNNDLAFIQEGLRIMTQVAREQGDTTKAQWITWLINTRFQAPKQDTTLDMIFNDRTTPATSPGSLGVPTSKAFGWKESTGTIDSYMDNPKAGLGHVYMKSSWDPGASTTQAVFKAPPYYYFGHQHFDSLAFSIFKGEPLALPNTGKYFFWYEGGEPDNPLGGDSVGYPHQWYYYERTVSANSLLIMDPNEVIYMREPYYDSDSEYRDGGQRSIYDATYHWGQNTEGSSHDWGGLIRYEDTSDYTYSSADATKGYNSIVDGKTYLTRDASPKVSLVQRDFVYLKSDSAGSNDYFVVYDRIDSTNPIFKKVFLLHTIGEPVLNGAESTIYGNANSGLYQSDNTNSFTITNPSNKAKLFMKTFSPSATKVYKMGGSVTTTLTQAVNNVDGTVFQGPKIDLSVSSTAAFPAKPVVVIDDEAFMCDGKTATQLTGCIRGKRYYKHNGGISASGYGPETHNIGATVTQEYTWMIREADDNDWIAYPHDYGAAKLEPNMVSNSDDYGRWALRIETVNDETHTNFLNVLHPTVNMAETSMADTESIDSGNMAGLMIKSPVNKIVMFTKTKDLQTHTSYSITYTGTARHIITGLKPGSYKIYKNGFQIATAQASAQSILTFDSAGGSTFTLVSQSEPNCVMNDFTFYPVPTMARPAKGQSYVDPNFYTTITRITDSPTDVPASINYAQPGYPKHNIENADSTKLIIQSFKSPCWHVWNANPPYNKIRDIPIPSGYECNSQGDNDARWDNLNADILYFYAGPKFYQYNANTGVLSVVHDFTNDFSGETITRIGMSEEGNPSDDNRYWAFVTNSQGVSHQTHLIVYDKQTNSIISRMNWGDGNYVVGQTKFNQGVWVRYDNGDPIDFNFVGMSPSGNYVVTGAPPSWIYPRNLSSSLIINTHGHVAIAIDDEGREVLVWVANYYGPTGYVDHGFWAVMADLATGGINWLGPFGKNGNFHVSGNSHDKPGWAVVESYSPTCTSSPTEWADASIIMYELTRRVAQPTWNNHARVWRLAFSHMCNKGYGDDTFAKTNKKGTKVFFGSGWGQSISDSGTQYDVYQIDIPQECYNYFPPEPIQCSSQGGSCSSTACCSGLYCGSSSTCQPCAGSETSCTNGLDDDCDGQTDCSDTQCSSNPACIGCSSQGSSCAAASCCSGLYCDVSRVCRTCLSSESGYCTGGINEDCDSGTDCSDSDCYTNPSCCKTSGQSCTSGACCSGLTCQSASGSLPKAIPSADRLTGAAPLYVQFYGSGTDTDGTIASYRWSFGDGSGSVPSQNYAHSYTNPGNYKAVLTVTDNSGLSESEYLDIRVTGGTNSIPTASASATPLSGAAPLTVSFTGSGTDSDGTIAGYYWDFGTSWGSSQQNPLSIYSNPGNYIATLMVQDNGGARGNSIVNITVTGSNAVCVGCSKADINCNGCISQLELSAFIDRWKFNNQDVTMAELIRAIGEWKAGTGCS